MDCPRFELISKYTDESLIPHRATEGSAGYDFVVAEDTIVPSYNHILEILEDKIVYSHISSVDNPLFSLNDISDITKKFNLKPTLVPTGVKAYIPIPQNQYLQLSIRSSCPLKNWLILANGVGIIDADYYNNPDNEGHIYFQIINLFPEDIILHKGDKIGQGVFLNYNLTENDYEIPKIINKRTGGFGSTDK